MPDGSSAATIAAASRMPQKATRKSCARARRALNSGASIGLFSHREVELSFGHVRVDREHGPMNLVLARGQGSDVDLESGAARGTDARGLVVAALVRVVDLDLAEGAFDFAVEPDRHLRRRPRDGRAHPRLGAQRKGVRECRRRGEKYSE